jgi:serine phosphatase RsbU (regulator of sigma subunit)
LSANVERSAGANGRPNLQSDRFLSDHTRDLFVQTDWSRTPLGPTDQWPQSLRTIVDAVMSNRHPMIVLWGPELVQVYNDGYASLLGSRHPAGMGQRTRDCWPEVWDVNEPLYAAVLREGRETYLEDAVFPVERYGIAEDAYFSISYGPLRDDDAVVRGVLVAVAETTRKVLDQRRLRSLRQLAAVTGKARTAAEVGLGALDVLRQSNDDIPFALLYGATPDTHRDDRPWAPPLLARIGIEATPDTRFLNRWRHAGGDTGEFVEFSDTEDGNAEDRQWAGPIRAAYVETLRTLDRVAPLGLVILGCNPRTALDEHYREYLELIGAQLTTALENAEAFHRERRIADTLQRAALPLELHPIEGVRIDAVYEAGSGEARIGGDWYDAFALSDERIVVTIGDVCGSGVAAAAVMGGMRQMIRALAQTSIDPSFILDAADRAFRLEARSLFVTAFVVIVDLANSTMTYASAGHPPPLLRHADGRLEALYRPDLPIGLRGPSSEPAVRIGFPAGAALVLYTDGLTEESRDWELGENRVREAITSDDFATAAKPASYLRDAVLQGHAVDDIAILVIARKA